MNSNPYSSGTKEDDADYTEQAWRRRRGFSGVAAMEKVLGYLEQQVTVLELDIRRYREDRDGQRLEFSMERLAWVEAMIFWVNHNV